jgi:argininosuccinate lyase
MSHLLWQQGEAPGMDRVIADFTAGEDIVWDRVLFPHDVRATAAHVRGLQRIGILTAQDSERLCDLLDQLLEEFTAGRFILDERFEDGHSAIEAYLGQAAGALGARVHTGRSRNDQVAVATRLFMLECLGQIAELASAIGRACLEQAEVNAQVPMPGYTHLQRAVPSSIGLWMGGFAEAFADDVEFTCGVMDVLDACPLGTAAGYGVNLRLDREGVAAELGFSRLQINPMAVQNARGKYELMCLQAALQAMLDVRRLAWDLSLFTTAEFGFVRLPEKYTTGSSIMPNKANPDVVELLRGRAAMVEGAMVEIQSVLSLPSGYQRDLQLTKAPLIRGLHSAVQALSVLPALIGGLEFNRERMLAAITTDMFATDMALEQAAAGVPFRQAYLEVKRQLETLPQRDVGQCLEQRVSPGGCADLQLKSIGARLDALRVQAGERKSALAGQAGTSK